MADKEVGAPAEMVSVSGVDIAVRHRPGTRGFGVVWLGGFRSHMRGMKAQAIDRWTRHRDISFLRHDYSGHGESGGKFAEGNISKWLAESLAVFRRFVPAKERQILVGSSMGAWIALRMVQQMAGTKVENDQQNEHIKGGQSQNIFSSRSQIGGLLLIAPAPDFTVELLEPRMSAQQRISLENDGFFCEKSEYFTEDQPNIWTREMLEDGRRNSVLTDSLAAIVDFPVHIVHGMKDKEVHPSLVQKLISQLPASKLSTTFVEEGEHRLSRPQDIELILKELENIVQKINEGKSRE